MRRTYLDCFAVSARIVGKPSLIGKVRFARHPPIINEEGVIDHVL